MKAAMEGKPAEDFPNVEPLSKVALTKQVQVDTPDTAPTEEVPEGAPKKEPPPPKPPPPGTTTGAAVKPSG
jgi:hypothetical protein